MEALNTEPGAGSLQHALATSLPAKSHYGDKGWRPLLPCLEKFSTWGFWVQRYYFMHTQKVMALEVGMAKGTPEG